MRPCIFVSSTLFAGFSLAELLTATREADPTITRAPDIPVELLRKQAVNDRFIGWISIDGDWTSRTCDIGGTYFQSDEYWRCCATTLDGCNPPIGCVSGSLVYSFYTSTSLALTTRACTEVYANDPDATSWSLCNTGLMYENTADFNPATNVFCGARASRWTYYRVRPSETSSSTSGSSTSPSSLSQSASAGPTETDTDTASSATSTSDHAPIPQPTKRKSNAWIAGAVVGPIIGIALVGLLAWFLLSRRKKNSPPPPPPMQQQQQQHPPHGAPTPYVGSPTQPPAPYYQAQKPNMLPVGVASQQGWAAAPPPHSPTSQGSVSPHVPPQSLNQQQWQPAQGQQVYNGPSPSQSPPPPQQQQNVQAYYQGGGGKPPGVGGGDRPFSAELDGSGPQRMR